LASLTLSLKNFIGITLLERYRLAALPGVQAAITASTAPFGLYTMNRPVQRADEKPVPGSHPATAAEGLAFNIREALRSWKDLSAVCSSGSSFGSGLVHSL